MAKTIPQLTDATTVNAADELIVQQGGITKRATAGELMNNAPVTATGSTTARSLASRAADTVNVKDFGAVGDGVTDDTPAIHLAKAACLAKGGGTIYFPAGTYQVQHQPSNTLSGTCIEINSGEDNLRFLGDGPNSTTIIMADNQDRHVINLQLVSHCTIENLTIDGNRLNQTTAESGGYCIRGGDDLTNLTIRNVRCQNAGTYGIGLQWGAIKYLVVDNVEIHTTGRDGMDIKNRKDGNVGMFFNNVRVSRFGLWDTVVGDQAGLDIRGHCTMSNVYVYDYGVNHGRVGVRLQGSEAIYPAGNGEGGTFSRATNVVCEPLRDTTTGVGAGGSTIGCVIHGQGSQFANCVTMGASIGFYTLGTHTDFLGCISEGSRLHGFLSQGATCTSRYTGCRSVNDYHGFRLRTGKHVLCGCSANGSTFAGLLAEFDSTDVRVFDSEFVAASGNTYISGGTGFVSFNNVGIPNFGIDLAKPAVNAHTGNDGNLYSGTWTPATIGIQNVDTVQGVSSRYGRVGNIVFVQFKVNLQTLTTGATRFSVGLPVPTNFTNEAQASGTGRTINAADTDVGVVIATSGGSTLECRLNSTSATLRGMMFTATYQIL